MRRSTIAAAVALLAVSACGGAGSNPSPSTAPTQAGSVATPAPTDVVVVPENPLPKPAGTALPGDLIGRTYNVNPPQTMDDQQLELKLRAADDPHCMAMYGGSSTCFTVLWNPVKAGDPGARGSATIVDKKLVLDFALVPFDEACVGSSATYEYIDAGQTLRGVDTPACTFPGFREVGATACSSEPIVFDTRAKADYFALPMKITLPTGWKPYLGIVGVIAILHTGCPEGPDSTWWGPEFQLVEEAQIHRPSDVVSSEPETKDLSKYVPWPDDFFAWITALPGVTVVSGPEPISVGGVTGTQFVLNTPPLRPLIWMKGDHSPLGGGEPALERRFIIVETGGHTLFLDFHDDPLKLDARYAEFRAIVDTITFE